MIDFDRVTGDKTTLLVEVGAPENRQDYSAIVPESQSPEVPFDQDHSWQARSIFRPGLIKA